MKTFGESTNREVQILRGLAVTLVVLYHLEPNIFGFGYLGVNIFFVISGFIVHEKILVIGSGHSITDSISHLSNFLFRRFSRIFPALCVLVIASSLLIATMMPMGKTQNRSLSLGLTALFGSSNFFAEKYAGDYFNPSPNVFLHTWSLAVEIQFYFFFALLYFFTNVLFVKIFTKSKNLYFTCLFVVFVFSFFSFFHLQMNSLIPDVGYFTIYHAWEFILGLFAREFLVQIKFTHQTKMLLLTSCTVISIVVIFSFLRHVNQLLIHTLVVIATGTFLSFGLEMRSPRILLNLLNYTGDRSYSIYLWHYPLLVIAKHSPITGLSSDNRIIPSIIAILLTYVLSSFSYRFVEEKLR